MKSRLIVTAILAGLLAPVIHGQETEEREARQRNKTGGACDDEAL